MGIAFSFAPLEIVRDWMKLYREEAGRAGWRPGPEHAIYRGIAYAAESDGKAQADLVAFFGKKAAEQAQFQHETLGGPPSAPLITEPYFVGGPETLKGRFEALRDCGIGVVDLAWGIGDPDQREAAMDRFAEAVLPAVRSL